MATYNVTYNKSVDIDVILNQLTSIGVVINSIFSNIGVLNISAESIDFTQLPHILTWEEDRNVNLHLSHDWHQYRITTKQLPMTERYIPENLGNGVDIYVIDSGIDITHPEFIGRNIVNVYSFDGTFNDTVGHGTGVASLIVGNTLGVSPDATVKNVKINMGSSISLRQLLEAFDAIVGDKTHSVSVINCSWIIPKSQILDSKIIEMQSLGFVVVAAAGNLMQDANNYSPVGLDTVLGVAASDPYDRVIEWAPNRGSNWGPEVDITAPGIDVMVATLDGETRAAAGTSLAAAVVSGVVAQFINKFPDKISTDIQDLVTSFATSDVLFRNESIYATTPNRLLYTYIQTNFIKSFPEDRIFSCKVGETLSVPIDTVIPVHTIRFVAPTASKIVSPPWITVDELNNSVEISPSESVTPLKYKTYISFYDEEDKRIHLDFMILNVYDTEPMETAGRELYVHESSGDSIIVVRASSCEEFICPAEEPNECTDQKGCACDGPFCYTL